MMISRLAMNGRRWDKVHICMRQHDQRNGGLPKNSRLVVYVAGRYPLKFALEAQVYADAYNTRRGLP